MRLSDLLESSSARYTVKEVWSGREIGSFGADGEWTAMLRPHASELYLLIKLPLSSALSGERVHLDVFANGDCSGEPNASVELTAAAAAYSHCTHCASLAVSPPRGPFLLYTLFSARPQLAFVVHDFPAPRTALPLPEPPHLRTPGGSRC